MFLKINYTLKSNINNFVEMTISKFEHRELNKLLLKFNLGSPAENSVDAVDKNKLNQALRRSVVLGEISDLSLLLRFGADVNSQDNNPPEKKFTALHLALDKGNVFFARSLLYCGAKINIKDANNRTALEIINTIDAENKIELQFICKSLKLIGANDPSSVLANRNALFPSSSQGAASSAASAASASVNDEQDAQPQHVIQ